MNVIDIKMDLFMYVYLLIYYCIGQKFLLLLFNKYLFFVCKENNVNICIFCFIFIFKIVDFLKILQLKNKINNIFYDIVICIILFFNCIFLFNMNIFWVLIKYSMYIKYIRLSIIL